MRNNHFVIEFKSIKNMGNLEDRRWKLEELKNLDPKVIESKF